MKRQNPHAVALGRKTSPKKKLSSADNGKKGGYWTHKANRPKRSQ